MSVLAHLSPNTPKLARSIWSGHVEGLVILTQKVWLNRMDLTGGEKVGLTKNEDKRWTPWVEIGHVGLVEVPLGQGLGIGTGVLNNVVVHWFRGFEENKEVTNVPREPSKGRVDLEVLVTRRRRIGNFFLLIFKTRHPSRETEYLSNREHTNYDLRQPQLLLTQSPVLLILTVNRELGSVESLFFCMGGTGTGGFYFCSFWDPLIYVLIWHIQIKLFPNKFLFNESRFVSSSLKETRNRLRSDYVKRPDSLIPVLVSFIRR